MFDLKDDEARRPFELAEILRKLLKAPLSAQDIEKTRGAIDSATAQDAAMAIDALIAEGTALPLLEAAVAKFINLLGSALGRREFVPEDPFLGSLVAENAEIRKALDSLRGPLAAINRAPREAGTAAELLAAIREGLGRLGPIGIHYHKKENILFPVFEKKYTHWRCVSLMWSLHDRVREEMTLVERIAREGAALDLASLNAATGRLFFAAFAIVFREERILFPLVSTILSREERFDLYRESRAMGFAFLDRAEIAVLEAEAEAEDFTHSLPSPAPVGLEGGGREGPRLPLDAGGLGLPVLDALLKALPVDLTFVDADDRVAWFSNGPQRIFPRSPSIIGREVRNCHPASSVDRVMDIIESFRSGSRDREEFWIVHRGRFVYIRYVALRDASGAYLGTLESSQDLTDQRGLEGEKRLAI